MISTNRMIKQETRVDSECVKRLLITCRGQLYRLIRQLHQTHHVLVLYNENNVIPFFHQ